MIIGKEPRFKDTSVRFLRKNFKQSENELQQLEEAINHRQALNNQGKIKEKLKKTIG